ncbi:hypothetical protein [Spiroplasma floricola]|uniref:Uncharacterized protein n=1 Tax=Spiroplasma floricola 23-6 TaxID=1336749 RepID=A0A2K8SE93_9MOLU|nr:hypothetical protein [Spiroplasma floricola]AUB31776.1 hypothetical protein SFLOR_v1c07280 [Spiroplasma floricola 23-6]
MNILLGLVASVGLTSPSTASIINSTNSAHILSIDSSEKVDLTKIKIETTYVDVKNVKLETEEDMLKFLIYEIMDSADNDDVYDALYDFLENRNYWELSGYDFKIPEPEEVIETKLRFRALSENELFKGHLTANLVITNSTTVNPEPEKLANYITQSDIGFIYNPNENKIRETLMKENPKLKNYMFSLTNFKYSEVTLVGLYEFAGQEETINYRSGLEFEDQFRSRDLFVEAYNSTQYDSQTFKVVHYPVFGMNDFLSHFKFFSFEFSALSAIEDKNSLITQYHNGIVKYQINSGPYKLWDREYYGSVNWNFSKGYVRSITFTNRIEFEFKIEVKAYASWINTYYSRAKAKLNVVNIFIL